MRGFAPILIVTALLATVPLITSSNVVLNFLVVALLIALVGQGWNLLGGYGGQYSFGHAAFFVVVTVALALWLIMRWTDTGKAIRAVAKEKRGAELVGIDVAHIYAVTFGLGTACLAIAACLLIPTYYVNPQAGNAFVLIAFTIVVLGGMGSVTGALIGGLFVGVVESLSSLYLGESLGQIGIFAMFILVLLFRPSGLFGERA